MANDCLVLNLKGVADNSNLPVFGVVDCVLKKVDGYGSLTILSGKKVTITIPDSVDLWWNPEKTIKTKTFIGTGEAQLFPLFGDETSKVTCKVSNYWYLMAATEFGMDMKYWKYTPNNNIDLDNSNYSSGSIEELYNKTTMINLNVNGSADVGGSINTLADKMYAAGRISGTLRIYCRDTNVKKNGSSVVFSSVTFTENGWSFD